MIRFYATVSYGEVRPFMPVVPVMLSAASFQRGGLKNPNLPEHITERAADCGGFVATRVWGDYRFTPERYVEWLWTWQPQWAATMDYCCEPELTDGDAGLIERRQWQTTEMAWRFWLLYRDVPWCWAPTVQGWEIDDYRRHARDLKPLVKAMHKHYGGDAFRVGIGTLCQRADTAMIRAVAEAVSAILPGVPLHLWGIKLGALKSSISLPPAVASVDSAAWNGLFSREKRAQFQVSGMKQREWIYRVAMPDYLEKIDRALIGTKQLGLTLESGEEGAA